MPKATTPTSQPNATKEHLEPSAEETTTPQNALIADFGRERSKSAKTELSLVNFRRVSYVGCMEYIELLVHKYGYFATGIGCFFEGESVLVVAAFLAQKGYLRLDLVMFVAGLGAFLGDVVTFFLGKWKAEVIVKRSAIIRRFLPKAQGLLDKYGAISLFFMRFSYGLRATTGVICGVAGMPWYKFVSLAAVTCGLWAIIIGAAGYYFGHAAALFLKNIAHYERIIAGVLVGGSLLFWLFRYRRRRKNGAKGQI